MNASQKLTRLRVVFLSCVNFWLGFPLRDVEAFSRDLVADHEWREDGIVVLSPNGIREWLGHGLFGLAGNLVVVPIVAFKAAA